MPQGDPRKNLPVCDESHVPSVDFTSQIGLYGSFRLGGKLFGMLKAAGDFGVNAFSYNTPLSGNPYWSQSADFSVQVHKLRLGFAVERRSYDGGFSWQGQPGNFFLYDVNASTEGGSLVITPPQALAGFTVSIDNLLGLLPTGDTPQCRPQR